MLKCQYCGQMHDRLPLAIAYRRPPEYFRFSGAEREQRIQCNSDLRIVDEREFLLRGVLELPIADAGENFE